MLKQNGIHKTQVHSSDLDSILKVAHKMYANIQKSEKKMWNLEHFWFRVFQVRDSQPVSGCVSDSYYKTKLN